MRISFDKDEEPEIGLIALIDCIFFLLMFFMVATSFKHQDEGKPLMELPIQLPRSAVSLDKAVTGTSLMLVLKIGSTHLLFPGDAQWGTRLAAMTNSAASLTFPEKPRVEDLVTFRKSS